MPELPEVETVARTLRPHVENRHIEGVRVLRESCVHPLSMPLKSMVGATVTAVRRRGKLLLLDLHTREPRKPSVLVCHLRMTGRILPQPAFQGIHKHTRCVISLRNEFSTPSDLLFDDIRTFGKLMAATPEILSQWDFWRELGPEPLTLSPEHFARQLKGKRPLKQALLDQKVIAGIGNIYADEALFRAGLSPLRVAGSLSDPEIEKLLESIKKVLRLSIQQCGSSIRDYRDANGNVGAFQNSFQAYGRGGQPCLKCGAPMEKIKISGRSTVFCPHCQKA